MIYYPPVTKRTEVRKILDSLVERLSEIRKSEIGNESYYRVYSELAVEEAELRINQLLGG